MPGRPRAVAVPARLDVAALVGARPDPPRGVEGDAGQREHRRQVLRERLRGRPAVAAPRRRVDAVAPGPQQRVELLERRDGRLRDEQVAPQEAHGVLHGALLVARIGVAVAARASVMRPEQREQGRLRHLAAHHAPRLGGVVQHEQRRSAPDPLEHRAQPCAQALGPLREHRDAVPGVRVRQRHHEQLHAPRLPREHAPEVPEVRLRRAGRPLQLQVPVPRRGPGVLAPPQGHVPADRRVRPGVPEIGDHPVVYPLRRVPLLAGPAQVLFEHAVDPAPVGLRRRPRPLLRDRRGGGHVPHVGVLRHRVATHAELSGDLRPGDSPRVHLAYILLCAKGHGHLPFLLRAGLAKVFPPRGNIDGAASLALRNAAPLATTAQFPMRTVLNIPCDIRAVPIEYKQGGEGTSARADEPCLDESPEGHYPDGPVPRGPHRHGGESRTCGLSRPEVGVAAGADDLGDCFCRVASRGKTGAEGVRRSVAGVDLAGAEVSTDMPCSHIVPPGAAGVADAPHPGPGAFLARFNGVSTRRLGMYLRWSEWPGQARRPDAPGTAMPGAQAANGRYSVRRRALFAEPHPLWGYWEGRRPVMDVESLYPPEFISGLV